MASSAVRCSVRQTVMTKPLKAVGVLSGLLLLLLLGVVLTSCLRSAQEKARRCSCHSHLAIIGTTLRMYSSDHHSSFPSALDALGAYGIMPVLCVCPSTRSKVGPLKNVREWSDYLYISGLTEDDRPNIALIIEKPGNHQGAGGDVLFIDGHVEWVSDDVLRALLKEPWLECPRQSDQKAGLSDDEIQELRKRTGIIADTNPKGH